jgi:hypothetical protein
MLYSAMCQGVSRRLSSRKAEFIPRLFYVEFVVDKVALRKFFRFLLSLKFLQSFVCILSSATDSAVK